MASKLVSLPEYPVISANGSTNLSTLYNIYYFAPTTTGITYTYTLPPITCDGMRYKVVRMDRDNTSILTVSTSDSILFDGVSSGSINVEISRVFYFISYNFVWYAIRSMQSLGSGGSLFSGNFVGNQSSPYQIFSGNGSNDLFCGISYSGTANFGTVISTGYFVIAYVSGTPTVTITLRDSTGALIIATTTATLIPAVPAFTIMQFSTITQSLLPSVLSVLFLYITVTGGNNSKVGMCSFSLY